MSTSTFKIILLLQFRLKVLTYKLKYDTFLYKWVCIVQKKYLNLLKSLSEDKNFVSDFDMAASIEEKYDLVKSRFQNLPKDDFMEFMLEIQLEQSKLSEEELSQVSGGINKKSLATIAMLSAALGSMSSMNVANATGVEFVVKDDARIRGSERITGKALNDEGFKNNLLSLVNEIKGEIQTNSENYSFECTFPELSRKFNIRITPECVQHIILGDWYISEDGVKLGMVLSIKEPQICGGHTILSKQLLQDFNRCRGVPIEHFEQKDSMFNEVVSDASPNSVKNLLKIIQEVCTNPEAKIKKNHGNYIVTSESATAGCNVVVGLKPNGEVLTAHPLEKKTASEKSGPISELKGLTDVKIMEGSDFLNDHILKNSLSKIRQRIHQNMTNGDLKEFFSIKVKNPSIGDNIPEIFISESCVQNIVVGDWFVKLGKPHVLPKTIISPISGRKELVGGHTYKAFRLLNLFNTQKGLSGDDCTTLHSVFPKDVVKDNSPDSLKNLSNIINEVVNSPEATVEECDDKFFINSYSETARSEVIVVINRDGKVFDAFPNVPGIPEDFISTEETVSTVESSDKSERKPGSTSITNVSKTKNNNGNQKFKVEHSDKSKKMLGITMLQKTESEASKSITNNISEKISSRETASKAGESITNVSKPKNTNDNQKFKVERSKKGMLNIFKPVEPAKPESEK